MERLTKRLPDGSAVMDCDSCGLKTSRECTFYECRGQLIRCLAEYEDTGLEPEAVETVKLALGAKHLVDLETLNNTPISRLVELAEADKAGRVIVLPCKVGDTVFALLDDMGKSVVECEVKQIGLGNNIGFAGIAQKGSTAREYGVALKGFGKTVFLTREEAERAMEGRKNG